MSSAVFKAGAQGLMKDGSRLAKNPTLKNAEACKDLANITRTSYGPNGQNKMVINHIGKLFVTHDAATIMRELEVEHPAAKILVMASRAMEEEIGDGTNLVVILAGEFLNQAIPLLRQGLHTSEVIAGYQKASKQTLELLEKFVVKTVDDVKDKNQVLPAIHTAIYSKQPGYADLFGRLVTEACINVCPKNPKSFNVDNVRIVKLLGGSALDSKLLHGFVIPRDTEGTIKKVKGAKIAIYNCSVDNASTETKGQVIIKSADELTNFSKGEEEAMEKVINAVAKSGVNVVVSSQNFGDLALHYLERNGIMAVKVGSKHQMRRLCSAVNAQQMLALDPPSAEEAGRCDTVKVKEIGDVKVVVFKQKGESSGVSTILVRGATDNIADDIERALDDGINTYRALAKDGRLMAGGGAIELQLANEIQKEADATGGLEQYAFQKFSQALKVVPSTLAEVSGLGVSRAMDKLSLQHNAGNTNFGVDVDSEEAKDVVHAGVLDLYLTKYWAIKLASDAAVTVLSVDQIIMAKQAGGPNKNRAPGDDD
jgi:T-complex protein 1 subunit theta